MSLSRSLLAGLAGAVALTAVHQAAVATTDRAPRMDILGMRALVRLARAAGTSPPERLYGVTMAGDIAGNTLFYGLVGAGAPGGEWRRGIGLGLGAGVGALALPPLLGLGTAPGARTLQTAAMTVAWYTLGGLTAAATARALSA